MQAYHNDPAVKAKFVEQIRLHAEADEIVKGRYWEDDKGCAVGCLTHDMSGGHALFPDLLGWPEWLAHLIDTIFEGLPNERAKLFPAEVINAVPTGAHLEPVKWRFSLVLLGENAERVKSLPITDTLKQQILDAIEQVSAVNRIAVETGKWDASAARSAARSARSAAESAWSARSARSAAESAESARSAARSAAESAWSARSAARSAAWSARSARSAAESAESARSARSAAYIRYADALLKLLKTA